MPFDPVFQSGWKNKASRRTLRNLPVESAPIHFDESVEKQIGRSDALLGELRCPFKPGEDADEWRLGFNAERKSWIPRDKKKRKKWFDRRAKVS